MRILFINTIQMFGGGEIWMLRTLEGLRERNHHVCLLCRPETGLYKESCVRGIKTFAMNVRGDLGPLTIYRVMKILKKEKIQIVLTNMDKELRFGGIASKLTGDSVVIPRRGIDYPLKNKIQYRLSYTYLARAVIANSYSTKRSLLKNAPWLNPDKIHVIYNGINPNPYLDPIENGLKTELRIHKDHKIIGFVGQLDERKGLDYLLSSFKRVSLEDSTAHLCLIGKGPLESEINVFRSQNNLKNKIHLLGFRNDIVNIMKSIDVLVLPSLWEGFGIVLIEAMAAAKPAIVTDTSSMPEIVVDGETGRVVPVKDAEALSRAMLEILHDDTKAREWGQQGRQRVFEFFHVDQMINQLEVVFQTIWAMKKG